MKCIPLFILLFIGLLTGHAQQRKVLFVIADGIPADVMEKVRTPTLQKMAAAGSYKRAYVGGEKGGYSQSPTISAVGYNSLLTGTWANKHNVWDNDIDSPNYSYPTIFKLFKDQYPAKTIGIFSTWTDNRTKLAGEGIRETDHLIFDFVADGYELDTVSFPQDTTRLFIHHIDERVVDKATATIKEKAPDLSWVYLEYTDDMGHLYGDSKQFEMALALLDGQLEKLWQAVQYRKKNFKEDWLFIITTDHGRDAQTGKDHGGQSDRERTTWIISTLKRGNAYFKKHTPAIVDIMPTIAAYLQLDIPREKRFELDGVSLIHPVSVIEPKAVLEKDSIRLTWTALRKKEKIKIWLATTNQFKQGGKDEYQLIAEVPSGKQGFTFKPNDPISGFYKIVIEGLYNAVNCWLPAIVPKQ